MKVYSLPCRADNYCHLLVDPATGEAALFDAGDAAEIIAELEQLEIEPTHLFLTHHHLDHIQGISGLVKRYPALKVYQPPFALCHPSAEILHNKGAIDFAGGLLQFIPTPYHTLTSICYQYEDLLFTGDSLFVAGCGRMFEGSPEQLNAAFAFFASLPGQTKVFVGHDYAEVNLRFALSLEPDNEDAQKLLAEFTSQNELSLKRDGKGSRTTIAQEKRINLFFRFQEPKVAEILDPSKNMNEVDLRYQVRLLRNDFL